MLTAADSLRVRASEIPLASISNTLARRSLSNSSRLRATKFVRAASVLELGWKLVFLCFSSPRDSWANFAVIADRIVRRYVSTQDRGFRSCTQVRALTV